jgi:hypothetical protein
MTIPVVSHREQSEAIRFYNIETVAMTFSKMVNTIS